MTSNRTPLDLDADLRTGDEADRGNAQAEQNLAIAIRQARSAPLRHTGRCLYCEEPVDPPARFCEVDVLAPIEHSCIREWDALQKKTRPHRAESAITWTPDEPETEI